GARLSVDEYVAREQRLRRHVWARSAMATWFWLADDGALLASCETYRMDGWRRGVRGDVWGVASVFTEAALRGRGHATAMIDRLLDEARAQGAIASVLYSDVGERQYARSGYGARPAQDLVFAPVDGDGDVDGDVDALIADTLITDGESLTHAPWVPADHDGFVVWPTVEQLDWHVERTRTYGALLARPTLLWVGALAGEGQIRWMVDWKSDCLKVTLLATARADEAAALVRTAQRVAATFALREVRLWVQAWPFAPSTFDGLGGAREPRDGSKPMLAPLVPSLSASDWRDIPRAVWV
ncbi:MAG TPA: GNAT family N-acetyltransferase, partial [Polyangia bacterium]|nr:GNAT family N-acetyltransferase [Polyangia bacterium]